MNSQHRKTRDLYWSVPSLWCNTLIQCGGGGLPLGLMMNSTREELPPEVEVFLCIWTCVSLELFSPSTVVASPIYGGPVLFPNIEQEGSQQWRANLKGDN